MMSRKSVFLSRSVVVLRSKEGGCKSERGGRPDEDEEGCHQKDTHRNQKTKKIPRDSN